MKKSLILLAGIVFSHLLCSQTDVRVTSNSLTSLESNTRFYLGAGPAIASFQDVKFSNVVLNGTGAIITLGRTKSAANKYVNWGVDVQFGGMKPEHFNTKATLINPQIFYTHLRNINDNLRIGVRWDIMDVYFRNWTGLGNNERYDLEASTLNAAVQYQLVLKGQHRFHLGLSVGLLSFNREGTGFAFSGPQNVLEDGDFNYQDEAQSSPFGFKYYELETLNEYLNLRTSIAYDLSKRFSLKYSWHLRHSTEVKDYALTTGQHTLSVQFNLINR